MSRFKKAIAVFVAVATLCGALSMLASCGKKRQKLDNETTPLILSISEPEGVFSPFYSSAAYDSEIAGRTQIGMLTADSLGNLAFGDSEPVVSKDISITMYDKNNNVTSQGSEDGKTVYQFVLKKDVRFSDNQKLTIDDVLFNYYVYLDPAYIGSSTIYSTKIRGLAEYKTQNPNADEKTNEEFESQFAAKGQQRKNDIINYIEGKNFSGDDLTRVKADLQIAKTEFRRELERLWKSCQGVVEDYRKMKYPVTEDWECFFYETGVIDVKYTAGRPDKTADGFYITDYKDIDRVFEDDYDGVYNMENCIQVAYEKYVFPGKERPTEFLQVLRGWNIGRNDLPQRFAAEAKYDYFQSLTDKVERIEGIKVKTGTSFIPSAESISNTAYDNTYEMLEITIDGVDPKAIWNFGITVAPMHYYSDAEHVQAAKNDKNYDTKKHFGVEMGDPSFFESVVQSKNNVPMGAGPYKMSTASGSEGKTVADFGNDFFRDGMVYFERNEHFVLGAPVIKYMRYKVVKTTNIMNALTEQTIHFADPQAKEANIRIVDDKKNDFLKRTMVYTNGYGYIGISAKHVKDINVRRAIMTAIDTSYIKDYYPGSLSELIFRPMSLVSWVYEDKDAFGNKTAWSPDPAYFKENETERTNAIKAFLALAGYKWVNNSSGGRWEKNGEGLSFTFQVAGDSEDHPAWMVFEMAANWLNSNGWDIKLSSNNRVLSLLSTGEALPVWAAAWSSTIDPDMYQVYHKDSKARSTQNWGYDWIITENQGSAEEKRIIDELSDLIDLGRSTIDQEVRKGYYREALDKVMELAVELPLYQRSDMYVYNSEIIDESTLIPQAECTPFCSPLDKIWKVSFKVK